MSPVTLFKVYMSVTEQREAFRGYRRSSEGIAVDDDVCALMWQRLDRLAKKLEGRILRYLQEYESYELRNRDNAARLTGGYYE